MQTLLSADTRPCPGRLCTTLCSKWWSRCWVQQLLQFLSLHGCTSSLTAHFLGGSCTAMIGHRAAPPLLPALSTSTLSFRPITMQPWRRAQTHPLGGPTTGPHRRNHSPIWRRHSINRLVGCVPIPSRDMQVRWRLLEAQLGRQNWQVALRWAGQNGQDDRKAQYCSATHIALEPCYEDEAPPPLHHPSRPCMCSQSL